ncbi:MAG: J domain-containing protein [Treponemataceae bacterium]
MNKDEKKDYYSTIGEFLNKNLSAEEDPFVKLKSNTRARYRRMGNTIERRPPPKIDKTIGEESQEQKREVEKLVPVPQDLVEDFAILQLLPGSSLNSCKNSWRRLLKKFHPDTITFKKSITVEEAANLVRRINNSYKRIEYWYETGKILSEK